MKNKQVMDLATFNHPETWLEPEQLGRHYPPYQKTFDFQGKLIDDAQRALHAASVGGMLNGAVKGSLRGADALKLYELAFFSSGPVLELGTSHGLSASIIATALKNAGNGFVVTTVDLHQGLSRLAAANMERLGLSPFVVCETSDATTFLAGLMEQGQQFGFVFIDHSHTHRDVRDVSERLPQLLMPGGFVLFHDFNDRRNADPANADYGVYEGVLDGMDHSAFGFVGCYGCTALFRRSS